MRRLLDALLAGALVFGAPVGAAACIWDRDTLAMERQRFPGTLQLITGHFVRHGTEFYAWRIDDRTRRLETSPQDLALLDDLAAAYDKTGDHDAAIGTMERALALDPSRYETHANLGTFHAHAGHFDVALEHIDRAIEIDPQAHFGRERYQAMLIRYLRARGGGGRLPLSDGAGFAAYVGEHGSIDDAFEQQQDAIKGVLGMMHFGKHDSPILLEALGNLLEAGTEREDAAQLAARAYLRAGEFVDDPSVRRAYRQKAKHALGRSEGVNLRQVESHLQRELAIAKAFVRQMRADEERFLDTDDPDAAFDAAYFDGMDMSPPDPLDAIGRSPPWLGRVAVGTAALLGLAWGFHVVRRRRRGW